jgi:hypothetical protein
MRAVVITVLLALAAASAVAIQVQGNVLTLAPEEVAECAEGGLRPRAAPRDLRGHLGRSQEASR